MIDTIAFRVHDLRVHYKLLERLAPLIKYSKKSTDINKNDMLDYAKKGDKIHLSLLIGNQGQEIWTAKSFASKPIPSSNYEINIIIDFDPRKNFIHFEFSIPKYLYGCNIMQFVVDVNNPLDFCSFDERNEFNFQRDKVYNKLRKFVRFFFEREFPEFDLIENEEEHRERVASFLPEEKRNDFFITLFNVEFDRMDLCFNQIFESEKEALEYLRHQKKLKKRRTRDKSNYSKDWETSIYYKTDRYVAKIYHKGSEYKTIGDMKHHLRINAELKHEKYFVHDVVKNGELLREGLLSFANRILRYEISFRGSYISYIYKQKVFRKKCDVWKWYKKNFNELRKVKTQIKSNKISSAELKLYHSTKRYQTALVYEKVNSLVSEFRFTTFQIFKDYELKTPDTTRGYVKLVRFNKQTFDQMCITFEAFFNEFQIKDKLTFQIGAKKITGYNLNKKEYNKLWEDEIKLGYKKRVASVKPGVINKYLALLQTYTFDDMIKEEMISRTQRWRVEKILNDLGFGRNHIATLSFVPGKFNYERYYLSVKDLPCLHLTQTFVL